MSRFSVMRWVYRISNSIPSLMVFVFMGLDSVRKPTSDGLFFVFVTFLMLVTSILVTESFYEKNWDKDWNYQLLYPWGIGPVLVMLVIDIVTPALTIFLLYYLVFQYDAIFYFFVVTLFPPVIHFLFVGISLLILKVGFSIRHKTF